MITSIDFRSKNFTFSHDGIVTVVNFSDIQISEFWQERKVICFSHKDSLGRDCSTTLTRDAFTNNLAFNNRAIRGAATYDQDRDIFLLYRVLDGETKESAMEEVKNLEEQRERLDAKKREYSALRDSLIEAHVNKEDAIPELRAQKERISELGLELTKPGLDEKQKAEISGRIDMHAALAEEVRAENDLSSKIEIPDMGFTVSKEMQKLVILAQDDTRPDVNFKNVSLEHLAK